MSGNLSYSIESGHVYQRKFGTEELSRALKGFHLYIISRRPATRINEQSVWHGRKSTVMDIEVLDPVDRGVRERHSLEVAWDVKHPTFKTYMDGSYFSVSAKDGTFWHGDAWALATSVLGAPRGMADQEVIYVGQAYGRQGERSVYDRTKEHSKLQRIYEEHAGDAWDIFVSPIIIAETKLDNWDHLPDDLQGFDLEAVNALAGNPHQGNAAPKLSVDLVEHALVSAFDPAYNLKLVGWTPSNPTAAMRKLQRYHLRLMSVTLNGIDGMARYYSQACRSRDRGHTFYFELTEVPKRPNLNSLDPANWDEVMQIHARAMNRLARMAEVSGVILRWFGRDAPALRKPPEIVLE